MEKLWWYQLIYGIYYEGNFIKSIYFVGIMIRCLISFQWNNFFFYTDSKMPISYCLKIKKIIWVHGDLRQKKGYLQTCLHYLLRCIIVCMHVFMYSRSKKKKKKKHPYLFQYKLSYRNETGSNHHGLLSTLIWCFKIFLKSASTWGLYLTLIFSM